MDPVCHTLVGAALAQTGLRRRSALAGAALLIGANIPDVDVVAYAWGQPAALAFRRGWTHGILAVVVWPFLLCGGLMLWDRWRRRHARGDRPPLRPAALLGIAALAVVSHPILDTLNTYGVRWLMPFSHRWFYGDVLFIVDPWLWLVLGIGTWLSVARHRRGKAGGGRPALLALGVVGAYIIAMVGVGRGAAWSAARALHAAGQEGSVLLAGPVPLTPFRRAIVAGDSAGYVVGDWDLFDGVAFDPERYPRLEREDDPRIRAAEGREGARRFLSWARFPTARVRDGGTGRVRVDFLDLRYTTTPGAFGALTIGPQRRTPTLSEP